MSNYTTQLRYICEVYTGLEHSTGLSQVKDIISKSRDKIFNFEYPIFDDAYKAVLETKIIRHFYTREICAETVGLWKLWLEDKMNIIMPYYNQLYKSELIEFNPLYDIDMTTDHKGNSELINNETATIKNDTTQTSSGKTSDKTSGEETGKNTTDATHYDLYSDTPQGALTGIEDGTYLTNARKTSDNNVTSASSTNSSTSNGESTQSGETHSTGENKNKKESTTTDSYVQRVTGKTGGSSYSAKLKEFRDTFLNIDKMILNDLEDLFMQIY